MMNIDLFIPCFIEQIYPQTGMNMVKVLEKAGVSVSYNPEQTCCGQLAFNSGFWDHARHVAEKFVKDFNTGNKVVGPSCSCIGMVKNYYPEFFHNSSLHLESNALRKNIYEFTDFLVNVLKIEDFGAVFPHKITYHDACAALREYGLKDEPRRLLSHVRGLELIEMDPSDECCGFGGTFSVKNEPISTAMAEKKIGHALDTGAEYIVSTEASCLMHLQGYIDKHNLPIKTIHIADILSSEM